MAKFAVVKVDQDYDYVEGAECVVSFDTYAEADDYVRDFRQKQYELIQKRVDYIQTYVEAIKVPDLGTINYQEWEQFLMPYFGRVSPYITAETFKHQLTLHLFSYPTWGTTEHGKKMKDYNPPPQIKVVQNLFVVEIK
jgi:hypothetical protein